MECVALIVINPFTIFVTNSILCQVGPCLFEQCFSGGGSVQHQTPGLVARKYVKVNARHRTYVPT